MSVPSLEQLCTRAIADDAVSIQLIDDVPLLHDDLRSSIGDRHRRTLQQAADNEHVAMLVAEERERRIRKGREWDRWVFDHAALDRTEEEQAERAAVVACLGTNHRDVIICENSDVIQRLPQHAFVGRMVVTSTQWVPNTSSFRMTFDTIMVPR